VDAWGRLPGFICELLLFCLPVSGSYLKEFLMFRPLKSLGLLAVGGLAVAFLVGCQPEQAVGQGVPGPRPVDVTVVTLAEEAVTLTTELPGRTVAYRKAEVRPQVSGIIQQRFFKEGARVEAGDQLYQIDPASYQAAVQTARANLAKAEANFTSVKTRESRYRGLLGEHAISQQEYEDTLAAFLQAEAEVAVSKAALRTAQINLDYTQVNAPVSGRIGKSAITEGALVTAQQTGVLATIHQLDPIYVDVSQASSRLLELRRQIMSGNLSSNGSAKVQLTLEDGSVYEHEGELQFSEISVSESTGTVVMRALFPNPDHLLLPGMFVRAELQEANRADAVLVPQRAVSRDRQGNATALIVNGDGKVERRILQAERAIGNQWLVDDGLAAGDRVIVEGLQKIAPGAPVNAVEFTSVASRVEG
jgi:membrane fusion protein (multidrug efflux system)